MGKNSLIKSTSKKTAEKETEEKKKKTAAKARKSAQSAPAKGKKTAAKSTAKSKTTEKKKTTAKAKSTPKKSPKAKTTAQKAPKSKPAAKKAAAPKKKAAARKPPTVKELLFQKFDTWTPKSVYKAPPTHDAGRDYTAPPMISADSPKEEARMRKLLFARFSPDDLEAAAKESAAKRAAEKKAAEKAAAEKAAKEKKDAEKAEAEKKAAAQEAAAEKQPPEAEVSVSYSPPPEDTPPADPMDKAFKYSIAGFAALLLLLIGYSFANTGNYYLDSANGGLKIYQGRFAPMGKELMITLPGVKLAEPAEDLYSRSQVFPLIYNFYLDKADALLAAPGLPDYEGIRRYLQEALQFATASDQRKAVYARIDGIELMTLLYKADVAASKSTLDSLEEALDYLNEAARLEIDTSQAELIDQKRETVRAAIDQLQTESAGAETQAAAAPQE